MLREEADAGVDAGDVRNSYLNYGGRIDDCCWGRKFALGMVYVVRTDSYLRNEDGSIGGRFDMDSLTLIDLGHVVRQSDVRSSP